MTATGAGRNSKGSERTAAMARRLMGDQHRELRRHLAVGIVELDTLVDRRVIAGERLRALLGTLRDAFAKHQTDEEALVLPILESDLPVGPLRARQLREEHARQRAELEALCARQQAADDVDLASRFDRLARTLLQDIADEERLLLVPSEPPEVRRPD